MNIQNILEHLYGVKKFYKKNTSELINILKDKYNIELIGTGHYGMVFKCPKWNYVVKIFEKDNGYLEFVDYCLQHQDNKHLPKFVKKPIRLHKFHTRPKEQTDPYFYMVRMEELEHCTDEKNLDMILFLSDNYDNLVLMSKNRQQKYMIYFYKNDKLLHKNVTFDEVIRMFPDTDIEHIVITFADVITAISWHINDLHMDNIMAREDGTLVITDPIVDRELTPDSPIDKLFSRLPKEMLTSGPDYLAKLMS